MIQNDADKDACVCCTEPKPGTAKKPPPDPFNKPAATSSIGSVTTSGFKFGSTPSSSSGSGFSFGTSATPKEPEKKSVVTTETTDDDEEYSKEYLAHLKCLNIQVSKWISNHVDKNPLVFLTPVFKDYEKHLKEIEEKHPKKKSDAASKPAASAPLLGKYFLTFLVIIFLYFY